MGCVYESFVPGEWYRWLEKEILWFRFRRAEPERMISGWTALSRDSAKTEGGKAHRGSGQIRSELWMSSKLSCPGFCPCRAKIRPARFASLCLRAIISRANVLPDIILSGSAGRIDISLPETRSGRDRVLPI